MAPVIGGVDTHSDTHCAAVIDHLGRLCGTSQFPTTKVGLAALRNWMSSFGELTAVGVEGTGTYGAELARFLRSESIEVREVPRPSRRLRRQRGKSDPLDAEAAARAVLGGQAKVLPKFGCDRIEAIRVLRVARTGAMKSRIAAINALKSLVISAPIELRSSLAPNSARCRLIKTCAAFRVDETRISDPLVASKLAMRSIARRILAHDKEIADIDRHLTDLVRQSAPRTLSSFGMGVETTAAILVAIGDNPERLRSEASLARLFGAAPIPASSGKTNRHRLHRGGVRQANQALHVAVIVRLRYCPKTQAYMARRRAEGLSKLEVIRCLKRYLVRELARTLREDYADLLLT